MDGCVASASEAMWREILSTDNDVSRVVVNLANCTRSQAAAAASASQLSHHSQLVGVQQFRQAVAIICWVLGLPG